MRSARLKSAEQTGVQVARLCWIIEENSQRAKDNLGFNHCGIRSWHGYQRHMSLVMAAAFIAIPVADLSCAACGKLNNRSPDATITALPFCMLWCRASRNSDTCEQSFSSGRPRPRHSSCSGPSGAEGAKPAPRGHRLITSNAKTCNCSIRMVRLQTAPACRALRVDRPTNPVA